MRSTTRRPGILILTIGLGTMLNPLNSSMISVALIRLQNDFNLTLADVSWTVSVFYLASAAGQPVMGKLSSMFGHKRLFLAGLITVAVASGLATFSTNFPFLLACRALQAIGSSTLFPSGMSMITSEISRKQGEALAVLSIFASTSAAFGPFIGGMLIGGWDWPAIFMINIPITLLSFFMAIFILPNKVNGKVNLKQIDYIGIFLFIQSILCLLFFLLSINGTINWWVFVLFIISSTLFYFYEIKHHEPFINISELKNNYHVISIYLQFIIINLIYYCYFFGFPLFLQQFLSYNTQSTGFIMLALAGFGVLVSPIAGKMIDGIGSKVPLVTGILLLLLGTLLLLTYKETSSIIWLLLIISILGMSNGFNNISTQTALYELIDPKETGSASGLFQTSRYLGAILSSSILGVLFNHSIDIIHFHYVAKVCIFFCLIVLVMALRLPSNIRQRSNYLG